MLLRIRENPMNKGAQNSLLQTMKPQIKQQTIRNEMENSVYLIHTRYALKS